MFGKIFQNTEKVGISTILFMKKGVKFDVYSMFGKNFKPSKMWLFWRFFNVFQFCPNDCFEGYFDMCGKIFNTGKVVKFDVFSMFGKIFKTLKKWEFLRFYLWKKWLNLSFFQCLGKFSDLQKCHYFGVFSMFFNFAQMVWYGIDTYIPRHIKIPEKTTRNI